MEIPFIKIEGLGNDYVYVLKKSVSKLKTSLPLLAKSMSDRHRGAGSDGMIVIDPSDKNTAAITIFNSDGSEAEFCGNGLRGAVLFLNWILGSKKKKYSISTKWDSYQAEIISSKDAAAIVMARLNSPSFSPEDVGLNKNLKNGLGLKIKVSSKTYTLYCLAVSNPHAVIFVDNFNFDWQNIGREIEKNSLFKNRINVMFTHIDSPKSITVMPWERGSGATSACGSGAAAATVISGLLGYTKGQVSVRMPGGSLKTQWDIENNTIMQEGPSKIAYSGLFYI